MGGGPIREDGRHWLAPVCHNTPPALLATAYRTRYDWGMQEMEARNFVANLRSQTTEYGTISRVAEHIGVHRVQMSRIVNGRAKLDLDQAEKIANFLGFQLAQMLLPPEKFSKLAEISIAQRN